MVWLGPLCRSFRAWILFISLPRGGARRCAQRLPLAITFPRLWRSRIKQFDNFHSLHFQMNSRNTSLIPVERIEKAIYLIRGEKVMLDRDLAKLYRVSTKVFNQAVKRHGNRFQADL